MSGQFVLILVNSYSNSNEYELTKMSMNWPKINFSYGITELALISVSIWYTETMLVYGLSPLLIQNL